VSSSLFRRSLSSGHARLRPLIALAMTYALLGFLLRFVLWWFFGRLQGVSDGALLWILPLGVVSDLVQSLYLLAPFAVVLWLMPDKAYRSRAMRILIPAGAFGWVTGFVFLAAIEYFFFAEFDARLNLVAVDYLMYPTEVIGEVRAEYPVAAVSFAAAAIGALVVFPLLHFLSPRSAPDTTLQGRTPVFLAFAVAVVASATGFETHTLALSDNRVANEIVANGASSFFRALRTNEIDYHTYYASRLPQENLRRLVAELGAGGSRFTRLSEGRLDRSFPGNPRGPGRLNVVVVASESFGAEFSKLYGSSRDWTPEFDRIAEQGVWFRHMYASGTRTVRGLEAIVTSLPPIPSVSVLRRPGNEGIANWGNVMRRPGYHTRFLSGGYGYFDNMNYFFGHNGFEVRDRARIPGRETRRRRPRVRRSLRGLRAGLFPSAGAKASVVRRHALRRVGGPRSARLRTARHPAQELRDPDGVLRARPLRPGRVDTLTTQVDIAPTVLGLLGLPYQAPFFGNDVLNARQGERVAFFSHNHDVAIYRRGKLAILGLNRSVRDLFYDPDTDTYRPAPPDPRLNDLAVAYYQTAFELFRDRRYN
jgi:phosphoglycerol transferase MdoB-like AlkP superfamily enzyme